MTQPPLVHTSSGRTPRTWIAVLFALAILAGLYSVGTLPWLLVLFALPILPAIWDLVKNPTTRFELNDTAILWQAPGQDAEVGLSHIEKARFDTRWDFSVRVTLILAGKRKQRIPQNATPPHQILEEAMKARGIKVERHHFRVI